VALLLVRRLLLAGSFRSELLVQFAPRRSTAVAGVGFGCCLLVPVIWFYHYFAPVLSFRFRTLLICSKELRLHVLDALCI
jgi:hypothetical protein